MITDARSSGCTLESERLLSIREVQKLTLYSRASIYRLIADGSLPPPRKLGAKKIGFPEREIIGWLVSRPNAILKNSDAEKV